MISIWITIVVTVVLLGVNYFVFTLGKKKGEADFLALLFIAGLAGKTDAFKNYNLYAKPGGIVFIGDSITQDFNVYEYFPDKQVYNRGIGGDTSKGVLGRLDVSVYELKPAKVFLNIGTNDLQLIDDGIENVFGRIKEIADKILKFDKKIELYIVSVYPVNADIDAHTVGKRKNSDVIALNEMISKIKGTTYINLFDKLQKDGKCNPKYSIEGLHLNQLGYAVLKDEFEKYM